MKHAPKTAPDVEAFDLATTYLLLEDHGRTTLLPVDEDFWTQPMTAAKTSRLVSLIRSEADWPNWEMHPGGDELISQVSGAMTLLLESAHQVTAVSLLPGQTVVVPSGVWHTADVTQAGDAIYITLGAGTQQRPRLPSADTPRT